MPAPEWLCDLLWIGEEPGLRLESGAHTRDPENLDGRRKWGQSLEWDTWLVCWPRFPGVPKARASWTPWVQGQPRFLPHIAHVVTVPSSLGVAGRDSNGLARRLGMQLLLLLSVSHLGCYTALAEHFRFPGQSSELGLWLKGGVLVGGALGLWSPRSDSAVGHSDEEWSGENEGHWACHPGCQCQPPSSPFPQGG